MSFASRSRELLWRLGVRPALAHASRPVRATLEAPELLLRILEFLPIDDVCGPGALRVGRYARRRYYGDRCLKAVSREFCCAARHALTRGRWRPFRLLEQRRGHEHGPATRSGSRCLSLATSTRAVDDVASVSAPGGTGTLKLSPRERACAGLL